MTSTSFLQERIASKLNNGLVRLASVRSLPPRQKTVVVGKPSQKGRVFRVGSLHRKPFTPESLRRNRRGFVNAQLNSVAHAPSLYHWLFHRCGVPFEETQALIQNSGLRVDDVLVTNLKDAEVQLEWSQWQKMRIELRTRSSQHWTALEDSASGNTEKRNDGFVPALHRALHRQYCLHYLRPGISLSSEPEDPRSFVHRYAAVLSPSEALGLNVLRPIGFMNSMYGLGLVTNDVSMVRYWNNEFLGNFGVYDVRFMAGTPPEVFRKAERIVTEALSELEQRCGSSFVSSSGPQAAKRDAADSFAASWKPSTSQAIVPLCSCHLERVPTRDVFPAATDQVLNSRAKLHRDKRLIIRTPLLPYRLVKTLGRDLGAVVISLIRSGPFDLPEDLLQLESGFRPLSIGELTLLFAFERKLKVNRMVLSLQEFNNE